MKGGPYEFRIRSVTDGASLRFVGESPDWPEYFWVELQAAGLECRSRVSAYEPRDVRFSDLFRDMATAWKGWKGEQTWESLEGELSLASTMDALGHVTIRVVLADGLPYRWKVVAELQTESGALERLAKEAEAFQHALETAA